MSELRERAGLVSEWEFQVNDLATTLLLNGPGTTVISGLKGLSEAARHAGFSRLAEAASDVLETLPAGPAGNSAVDEALRKGLATIQQILSGPTPDAAPRALM